MPEAFILRALLAGVGVACVTGVLGCFVVWRRMAYFGDSLSHSALLGIALGLVWGLNLQLATLLVCSVFAVMLVWLQARQLLATDTLLGILAHSALSVGMVTISLMDTPPLDLHGYLFGDLLAVTWGDVAGIAAGGLAVIAVVAWRWQRWLLMTLHEDLARAEGVNTTAERVVLMVLMAVVVAVSFRLVGMLLITSMLIIPAAAARQLARGPEVMAVLAALLGSLAVVSGLALSFQHDTPSGPSIIASAAVLFALSVCFHAVSTRHHQRVSIPRN